VRVSRAAAAAAQEKSRRNSLNVSSMTLVCCKRAADYNRTFVPPDAMARNIYVSSSIQNSL
jgi:hypothetical protein